MCPISVMLHNDILLVRDEAVSTNKEDEAVSLRHIRQPIAKDGFLNQLRLFICSSVKLNLWYSSFLNCEKKFKLNTETKQI